MIAHALEALATALSRASANSSALAEWLQRKPERGPTVDAAQVLSQGLEDVEQDQECIRNRLADLEAWLRSWRQHQEAGWVEGYAKCACLGCICGASPEEQEEHGGFCMDCRGNGCKEA